MKNTLTPHSIKLWKTKGERARRSNRTASQAKSTISKRNPNF